MRLHALWNNDIKDMTSSTRLPFDLFENKSIFLNFLESVTYSPRDPWTVGQFRQARL